MKIFNTNKLIDLQKSILWQYDKAEKLSSIITQKQKWYKLNVSDFISMFFVNIFNLKTANDFGLNVWGKILNFPRQIKLKQYKVTIFDRSGQETNSITLDREIFNAKISSGDDFPAMTIEQGEKYTFEFRVTIGSGYYVSVYDSNGNVIVDNATITSQGGTSPSPSYYGLSGYSASSSGVVCSIVTDYTPLNLSTEQYRFLLLGQILKFKMNCTVPEINKYLRIIFNQDNNKYVYVIDNHDMSIQYLIQIPISKEIQVLLDNVDFLPRPVGVRITFEQELLYRVEIVNEQDALIQFTVNGETINASYVDVEPSTDVSWVVSKNGYITQTGSELNVQENTTKNITLDAIGTYIKNVPFFVNSSATTISRDYATYDVEESGTYKIEIAGGAGYWLDEQQYGYCGGKLTLQLPLVEGDEIKIDALAGGWYPVDEPNVNKRNAGGSGVALYINDELIAVAGGGASDGLFILTDNYEGYTGCGGGGYLGGNGTVINNSDFVMDGRGVSADGTKNNVNKNNTLIAPCGGGINRFGGYGGSGYINSNYRTYVTESIAGTRSNGNLSYKGYLKITFIS